MAAPPVKGWETQILRGVGAPVTPNNLRYLRAWAKAEGGSASNNPFNTTLHHGPSSDYNSVGVKNYGSPEQGIQATVATLLDPRYAGIVHGLRSNADPAVTAHALANSPWGTGGLVLKMLGDTSNQRGGGSVAAGLTATPPPRPSLDVLNIGNEMMGLPQLPSLPAGGSPTPQGAGGVGNGVLASGQHVIQAAKQYLGTPYRWGGSSPQTGFDCSGLLQYVWKQSGINIPRTTYEQWKAGTPVKANQLQAGDAVFFEPTAQGPGHVGMYLGNGKFIESPHTGANVRISSLAGRTDFVGARRFG